MAKSKKDKPISSFDEQNAAALVEMLTDLHTSEATRIAIINELLDQSKDRNFFEKTYNDDMSLGECPNCKHINHWLIPEDILAQMGWVTHKEDKRVPKDTDVKICPQFAESCKKKKTIA